MVYDPHVPNLPDCDVTELTPGMITEGTDVGGNPTIIVPAGPVSSDTSLGDLIEMSTGQPLDGGPLNIVGV
jgi:hypothetical protein